MMNKIPMLEKFAAQSLVYVDTGLSDGKELVFSKEKFAELIVQECATIINDIPSAPQGSWSDGYYEGCRDSANQIRQHFGIEE
jgi:hypothetical protein